MKNTENESRGAVTNLIIAFGRNLLVVDERAIGAAQVDDVGPHHCVHGAVGQVHLNLAVLQHRVLGRRGGEEEKEGEGGPLEEQSKTLEFTRSIVAVRR